MVWALVLMTDFICMFQHIPVPEVSDGVGSSPDGRLYLFQHIPVPEVSDGVGSSPDGRLYLYVSAHSCTWSFWWCGL